MDWTPWLQCTSALLAWWHFVIFKKRQNPLLILNRAKDYPRGIMLLKYFMPMTPPKRGLALDASEDNNWHKSNTSKYPCISLIPHFSSDEEDQGGEPLTPPAMHPGDGAPPFLWPYQSYDIEKGRSPSSQVTPSCLSKCGRSIYIWT